MSGSPGKERRGRESHILWTLCHQDNSGCKFELLWRGPDLQMPLMGMLSTIPLSKKPAEVEGSTWEIAQGVKAHLTPWWPGSEQPWEIAGSGSSIWSGILIGRNGIRTEGTSQWADCRLCATVTSRSANRRNISSLSKQSKGNTLSFGTPDQPIILISPCLLHLNS